MNAKQCLNKNKDYSDKLLSKLLTNITTEGQFVGGEHTIKGIYEDKLYSFVMLKEGAWRGGNTIYYRMV